MHYACDMVWSMGHIQIRNVPEDVHRTLKARAATKGMSLSEYLLAEVTELADQPSLEEFVARIRSQPRPRSRVSGAEAVREARTERSHELDARR
ncbi:MAG: antitoxin FitA [Gaiellaceae bacterium]|nr:antitoxin FitA [Gaiellaceae bacterium]MDX6473754.1 antitoxin FitA [Gaiellaceae bacterium]